MTSLRIMNWNIETFGWDKLVKAGGCEPIARIIAAERPDIVCILEVSNLDLVASAAIQRLSESISAIVAAEGEPGLYETFLISPRSSTEIYAFIIKDTARVWPLVPTLNGEPLGPVTLCDLTKLEPGDGGGAQEIDWKRLDADARAGVAEPPGWFPLVDMRANSTYGRKRARTTGQPVAEGGLSQGQGYRLACLGMFRVRSEQGGEHLIPIVVTHYAADAPMAATQMADLVHLHIAQLYRLNASIKVEGRNHPIENLIFTGDFNIDFLEPEWESQISGYSVLTRPLPDAAPDDPGEKRKLAATIPNVDRNEPPTLGLDAAVRDEATHLIMYGYEGRRNLRQLRDKCLDNLFYGGPALRNLVEVNVVDVPRRIAGSRIDVRRMANYYASRRGDRGTHGCRSAQARPLLKRGLTMTADAALIGARLLSDHLPVVVTFNLP